MNIIYLAPKNVSITTADMSCSGQLLLWSIRTWVMGMKRKSDYKSDLKRAYHQYKMPEASIILDHFMYCLSFGAKRAIDIRCILSRSISSDELTLINIMANCQQGKTALAGCMLRELCNDKYVVQTKSHAMAFTDIILNKANMTLQNLKLTRPICASLHEDNITSFPLLLHNNNKVI